MEVQLVSPEQVLYVGEADMVIARTLGGGEIASCKGHAAVPRRARRLGRATRARGGGQRDVSRCTVASSRSRDDRVIVALRRRRALHRHRHRPRPGRQGARRRGAPPQTPTTKTPKPPSPRRSPPRGRRHRLSPTFRRGYQRRSTSLISTPERGFGQTLPVLRRLDANSFRTKLSVIVIAALVVAGGVRARHQAARGGRGATRSLPLRREPACDGKGFIDPFRYQLSGVHSRARRTLRCT